MDDHRFAKRFPVKLLVKYGLKKLSFIGFTVDVSKTGIYLKTNLAFSPDTELLLKITLPNKKAVELKGKVMRVKNLPPEENQIKLTGMGVKFIHKDPVYLDFIKNFDLSSSRQ